MVLTLPYKIPGFTSDLFIFNDGLSTSSKTVKMELRKNKVVRVREQWMKKKESVKESKNSRQKRKWEIGGKQRGEWIKFREEELDTSFVVVCTNAVLLVLRSW